jgi:hypothetical protein
LLLLLLSQQQEAFVKAKSEGAGDGASFLERERSTFSCQKTTFSEYSLC